MKRVVLVAILLAFAAASTLAAGPAASATPELQLDGSSAPLAPTRTCRSRGEGQHPFRARDFATEGDLRVGPVSFKALRLAARRAYRTDRINRLKAPPVVRAGRTVTVAIAAADRGDVGLDFLPNVEVERPEDGQSAIRFEACPSDEPAFSHDGTVGYATAFPGAFVVRGTRCFTLEIWIDGREEPRRVTVKVGSDATRRCPAPR
ncbi:MAG: hypothetical protein R3C15_02565 [Thermoleophilia bacterium]